jgi:hypothetical protein
MESRIKELEKLAQEQKRTIAKQADTILSLQQRLLVDAGVPQRENKKSDDTRTVEQLVGEVKEVRSNLERRLTLLEKSVSTMVTQNSQSQRSLQNQVRSGVKLAQRAGQRFMQQQNQKKDAGRRGSTGQIEQRKAQQLQQEVKQEVEQEVKQEVKQDMKQQQQGSADQRLEDDAMDVDQESSQQQKKDVQGSGKAMSGIEERRRRTLSSRDSRRGTHNLFPPSWQKEGCLHLRRSFPPTQSSLEVETGYG